MSVNDLVFSVLGTTIYDPYNLVGSSTIRITNLGETLLEGLGIFITPSTNLGDMADPATYGPYTDYESVLEWGTAVELTLALSGGIKVTRDTNSATGVVNYFSRSNGSKKSNKLPLIDIPASSFVDIILEFEIPIGEPARRLFVNIAVE